MEKTLTLEPSDQEAAEILAAIDRCFAEIDELRDVMRLDREALERSSERIDLRLTRIEEILAESRLRAA